MKPNEPQNLGIACSSLLPFIVDEPEQLGALTVHLLSPRTYDGTHGHEAMLCRCLQKPHVSLCDRAESHSNKTQRI